MDSDVHPSLHPICHQIVYAKFNLKIHVPSPYERETWHYGQGNTELIRKAVHELNWQKAFNNLNIHGRISFFNKAILNIVSNFIPHETAISETSVDKYSNKKQIINDQKVLYEKYLRGCKNTKVFNEFKVL